MGLMNFKFSTIFLVSLTHSIRKGNQIISSTTRSHNNLFIDNETSSNSSSTSSSPSPGNSPPRNSDLMNFHKSNTSTPFRAIHDAPVSFESMIRETEKSSDGSECETIDEVSCDINNVPEGDLKKLQPVLWLELATIFDKHHIRLDRRKPFKRKRKEEGNVFNVSLNALIRRDQQLTEEDTSLVPLILQSILGELTSRGAKEEGILRVAGHKQKVSHESNLSSGFLIIIFSCETRIFWNAAAVDLGFFLENFLVFL